MFIACPHCRYLVATDPRTQTPPARCSRCGGALTESSPPTAQPVEAAVAGQSFASLLRQDDLPTSATSEAVDAATNPDVHEDAAQAADAAPETATAEVDAAVTGDGVAVSAHDPTQDSPSPVPDESANMHEPASAALAGAVVAVQRTTARAPGFLRAGGTRQATPRRIPRWQWLSVIVLLLALVLQMLIADRARLAGDAGWRPIIMGLCNAMGCSVPPWREPQAFVMLDRDVRPLVGTPGVLLARATFRNDARWAQPWPVLLVTLKDADGRSLGARAIAPTEYLRGGAANRELAPGQSAQVAVQIREPSASVVAFSFDFR